MVSHMPEPRQSYPFGGGVMEGGGEVVDGGGAESALSTHGAWET